MKRVILFLAANPSGTSQLALNGEARAIQDELSRSAFRDRFELVTRWAVTPLDLLRELSKVRPTIVHFSDQSGRASAEAGLLLQDQEGKPKHVSVDAIERAFAAAGAAVQLVVLNACYSEPLAKALLRCVSCVVGTRGPVLGEAARSFAVGLYGALGDRESVASAHAHGCAAILLTGAPAQPRPELITRGGTDATQLLIAGPPPAASAGSSVVPGGAATGEHPRTSSAPIEAATSTPPQGLTMSAAINGGIHPILAQNSTIHVTGTSPGQLKREEAERRARMVTQLHWNDSVARLRARTVPPGAYFLLSLVLLIIAILAELAT